MNNPLSDIKNPAERRQRVSFWLERYAETQPLMMPEGDDLKKNFPTCGDEGLRLQGAREEFQARHERVAWNARNGNCPQDGERLNLTVATEKAVQDWRLDESDNRSETAVAESLGKLLEYDRRMGHPVADQTRDLTSQPATPAEQAAWMLRDGRELSNAEQEFQPKTDIFHARTRQEHLGLPKLDMRGDWSRPGPRAVMPNSIPDPRPSLAPEGPKMAAFQALTQPHQPQLDIAGGMKERLAKQRGLSM